MASYKLEETPTVFISPNHDDKFTYAMAQFNNELRRSFIRYVNLKEDKLIVYGTEIKEPILQNLYESLRLGPRLGKIYVNCDGACYIWVWEDRGFYYKPLQSVIFDWSRFGVIVPNSVNDLLRKQLHLKDLDLLTAKKEIEELKEQLSSTRKDGEHQKMELQKVRKQLSLKEFEFDTKNVEFELCKEELKKLYLDLSTCKNDYENTTMELQRVKKLYHDQVVSNIFELKSTRDMLEISKERVKELEEQVSIIKKEKEDMKMELKDMQDQVFTTKKENEDMKVKLKGVQDQVSSNIFELKSTKNLLETSKERVKELEEQVFTFNKKKEDMKMELKDMQDQVFTTKKEKEDMKMELKNMQDQVSLVEYELKKKTSTRFELEVSNTKINDLECQLSSCKIEKEAKEKELLKVQEHLSLTLNEVQESTKIWFEFNEKVVQHLKDQPFDECYAIKEVEVIDD